MTRSALQVLMCLLFVLAPEVCPGPPASVCRAHGGHHYKPPPPMPGEPEPEDVKPEPRWRRTTGTPRTPGGPAGGVAPGASGFVRRARNTVVPTGYWEYWWARNRYDYLVLPAPHDLNPDPAGNDDDDDDGGKTTAGLRSRCVTTFRIFMEEDSSRLRSAALLALARLDDEDSLAGILAALEDEDQSVRLAAVTALGLYSGGRARYALLHLAGNTEHGAELTGTESVPDDMRSLAIVILGLVRSMGAESELTKIARDGSAPDPVRAMALEGLGLLGGEDCLRLLAETSTRPALESGLLSATMTALARTRDAEAMSHLLRGLKSKHDMVRLSAAQGIGLVAPPGDNLAVKRLFQCYSRTTGEIVGGCALTAMARIGGPEACKNLRMVLKRGTSTDIPWACLGLGITLFRSPDLETPEELLELFRKNGNTAARSTAALALGMAGHIESCGALEEIVAGDGDARLRGYAALALGMLGEDSSITVLREALSAENVPPLNSQAAIAVCLLDDTVAVPLLEDALLTSANEGTKAMAARSLLHMGKLQTVRNLIDFLNTEWSDEITQAHCIILISKLLTDRDKTFLDRVASGSNFADEYPILTRLLESGA